MKVDDRVRVDSQGSIFDGQCGVVVEMAVNTLGAAMIYIARSSTIKKTDELICVRLDQHADQRLWFFPGELKTEET